MYQGTWPGVPGIGVCKRNQTPFDKPVEVLHLCSIEIACKNKQSFSAPMHYSVRYSIHLLAWQLGLLPFTSFFCIPGERQYQAAHCCQCALQWNHWSQYFGSQAIHSSTCLWGSKWASGSDQDPWVCRLAHWRILCSTGNFCSHRISQNMQGALFLFSGRSHKEMWGPLKSQKCTINRWPCLNGPSK